MNTNEMVVAIYHIIDRVMEGDDRDAVYRLLLLQKAITNFEPIARPTPTATDNFPKVRPHNRKAKSTDVACPTCEAKPTKPCFTMTTRGKGGLPTDEIKVGYHKTRTEKAQGKR